MSVRRSTQPVVSSPRTERGERFLEALHARVGDLGAPRALQTYHDLKEALHCQSSPPKLALLDAAGSTLGPGERYLEVGSYTGASLIAAARDNPQGHFIGVDDFSQFDGTYEVLQQNLAAYGLDERVEFVIGDCWEVLGRPAGALEPISVYFFDGPHEYEDQYRALQLAEPHLQVGALVVVDDTRWRHVSQANRHFVAQHPGWHLLCDLPSASIGDDVWWNGLQVFELVEHRAPAPPTPVASVWRGVHGALRLMQQKERYHRARRAVRTSRIGRRVQRAVGRRR